MASSSSPFLVSRGDGSGYRFRSQSHLCALIGISPPYNTCVAYAPYARNAPHCSRSINKGKRSQVPALLASLCQATIPSMAAGLLLERLSTHAVCGITGWHQNKAAEVYDEWCVLLWDEYLRMHGLDPTRWTEAPRRLSKSVWEVDLEVAQREQQYYDEEEDDDDDEPADYSDDESDYSDDDDESDHSDGDKSDYSDDESWDQQSTSTPDTTTNEFDQSFPNRGVPIQPPNPPKLRKSTLSVYVDPVAKPVDTAPGDVAQMLDPAPAGRRDALRPLDPNTAISRSRDKEAPANSVHAVPSMPEKTGEPRQKQGGSKGKEQSQEAGGSEDAGEINPICSQASTETEAAAVVSSGLGRSPENSPDLASSEPEITAKGQDEESDSFETDLLVLDDGIFADVDTAKVIPAVPVPLPVGFRVYSRAPVDPCLQLKRLLKLMAQTVSLNRRNIGAIYAFERPSLPGFLKIGYVKHAANHDPVLSRLEKWQVDCGHPITEVFRVPIPCKAVERIESLVHLTLQKYRRVEDPPCERCRKEHDEWFEIEEHAARRVVDLWALFAQKLPYDRFGKLVDFWSEKVNGEQRRVGSGDTVEGLLDAMPRLVEESTRSELEDIVGLLYVMSLR